MSIIVCSSRLEVKIIWTKVVVVRRNKLYIREEEVRIDDFENVRSSLNNLGATWRKFLRCVVHSLFDWSIIHSLAIH